ncbi:hypothetical protein VitviT2T_022311 [Vitis vinifera]|uniref:Large ribosomal subunit protein mL54 n=1 Tax=Vitis vinifera TaxID=29760 RepID=A0ABY9DBX3_VITVI|nr:hypothetical protein VitviT2T_022311 [Vitis vinifera]
MQGKEMTMNRIKSVRSIIITREAVRLVGCRTFAVGGKAKKGSKGGGASDAPKASTLSKEVKSTTTVGANILKDGTDPKVLPDSEYPDWLWHLLDKRPALSQELINNLAGPHRCLHSFWVYDLMSYWNNMAGAWNVIEKAYWSSQLGPSLDIAIELNRTPCSLDLACYPNFKLL